MKVDANVPMKAKKQVGHRFARKACTFMLKPACAAERPEAEGVLC